MEEVKRTQLQITMDAMRRNLEYNSLDIANRILFSATHSVLLKDQWAQACNGSQKTANIWKFIKTLSFSRYVSTAKCYIRQGRVIIGTKFFLDHMKTAQDLLMGIIHERDHLLLDKIWGQELQGMYFKMPAKVMNIALDAFINAAVRVNVYSDLAERYFASAVAKGSICYLLQGRLSQFGKFKEVYEQINPVTQELIEAHARLYNPASSFLYTIDEKPYTEGAWSCGFRDWMEVFQRWYKSFIMQEGSEEQNKFKMDVEAALILFSDANNGKEQQEKGGKKQEVLDDLSGEIPEQAENNNTEEDQDDEGETGKEQGQKGSDDSEGDDADKAGSDEQTERDDNEPDTGDKAPEENAEADEGKDEAECDGEAGKSEDAPVDESDDAESSEEGKSEDERDKLNAEEDADKEDSLDKEDEEADPDDLEDDGEGLEKNDKDPYDNMSEEERKALKDILGEDSEDIFKEDFGDGWDAEERNGEHEDREYSSSEERTKAPEPDEEESGEERGSGYGDGYKLPGHKVQTDELLAEDEAEVINILQQTVDNNSGLSQLQRLLNPSSEYYDRESEDTKKHTMAVLSEVSGTIVSLRANEQLVQGVTPFAPDHISKRDFLWVSQGYMPTQWQKEFHMGKPQGVVVYMDVSGSMQYFWKYVPKLTNLIKEYVDGVYQFSTQICKVEDGDEDWIFSTSGTDFNTVARHIIKNHFESVVLISDGEGQLSDEYLDQMKGFIKEFYYIKTRAMDKKGEWEPLATSIKVITEQAPQDVEAQKIKYQTGVDIEVDEDFEI